ncbi:glycosyltransferase family 4 protein [Brevibacillus humidisoli]|uniref:glycosyltransferase family 4 protein n=1 Tax=Brevibacillus humidisoli TaxID=2895522 RepID=UPI001E41BE50|nr:glycosyltransferase family 4 protein [Brevibacillus humidisoli]UFJ42539.1 glycosyltransferase family 4 protein [Brevibacillus humidisoli]
MRIAIATVQVPFEYGGAEFLAANLKHQLLRRGFEAEIVTMPFKWYPSASLLGSIRIARLLDLSEVKGKPIDLLIALKFPIYLAEHQNKVLWLLHQHREAYDLWGTEYEGLHTMPHRDRLRKLIMDYDRKHISRCQKIYTISATVSTRLRQYNGIASTPVYHPPFGYESFRFESVGDYIFCPARLEELKRQHLLIESLRYVKSPVKVLLAGVGKQSYIDRLESLIEKYALRDKVHLIGWISEEEKASYYANALAVYYAPFQEDYGYVTLEAFFSGKAVITCTDSGGPLEFVQQGTNGFTVPPDPMAVAETIDQLYQHKRIAKTMGMNGQDLLKHLNLSWDAVIERLTA